MQRDDPSINAGGAQFSSCKFSKLNLMKGLYWRGTDVEEAATARAEAEAGNEAADGARVFMDYAMFFFFRIFS